MRTAVPEKLLKIVEDIDTVGSVGVTRLTVLKKWFERPGRLPAFGRWVARRSAGRQGKTKGPAGALLDEARALLGPDAPPALNRRAATSLHDRARGFWNEYEHHQWVSVRIVNCWPLLLVEKGLAICLGEADTPSDGYKLVADYCTNYDPRYGSNLNGPSRGQDHGDCPVYVHGRSPGGGPLRVTPPTIAKLAVSLWNPHYTT